MAYFALFRRFHCFCQQGAAGNKDVAVMLTRLTVMLVLHIGVVIIKISMLLIMMVLQVIAMALVVRLFVRLSTNK